MGVGVGEGGWGVGEGGDKRGEEIRGREWGKIRGI